MTTTAPHARTPRLARTPTELTAALITARTAALTEGSPTTAPADAATGAARPRRAVVMTMGALHSGHEELVRAARQRIGAAGQLIVTIFVNPLQFGPGEDFEQYPRDLDADLAKLAASDNRVDVVFAPDQHQMYPDGPIVTVTAGHIGEVLEGAVRPGHFDGVLTVVLKLLHLIRPDVAIFGEKDAQQLLAVRRMVTDLNLDVEILGVPILRDADGLALSSRNVYLTVEERRRALALHGALQAGAAVRSAGAAAVLPAAHQQLAAAGITPDYLVLVDPTTVGPVPDDHIGPALLLVAARVGTTRLIDNLAVTLPGCAGGAQ